MGHPGKFQTYPVFSPIKSFVWVSEMPRNRSELRRTIQHQTRQTLHVKTSCRMLTWRTRPRGLVRSVSLSQCVSFVRRTVVQVGYTSGAFAKLWALLAARNIQGYSSGPQILGITHAIIRIEERSAKASCAC